MDLLLQIGLRRNNPERLQEEVQRRLEVSQHKQSWVQDQAPGICNHQESIQHYCSKAFEGELWVCEDADYEQYTALDN